jgi:dTDP-4-amino-4,6-dideoxygalactose transaminase
MGKENIYVTRATMPPYEEYIDMIKPLWESRWITNMGGYHSELESKLKGFLEVGNLSLLVNGHMALEMAIQAMGFPKGGEVITTPFTFISTTHAIVRNSLQPVFCDIKMDDYTIDETKIEALITDKTVAIIPVHVFGNVCAIEEIERIAAKYDLKVIYDAAHAFGVKYKGRGIGDFGDASIFSFHATKVFNCVEGGAVASRSEELMKKLYDLKNFGIRSEELVVSVGANAKMNEFSAIMGLCNLMHIDESFQERKRVAQSYIRKLSDRDGIRLLRFDDNIGQNYAYFPILVLEDKFGRTRDEVYNVLAKHNIRARKYFYPLASDQACFKNRYRSVNLETARYCADRILILPLFPELGETDIVRIAGIICEDG